MKFRNTMLGVTLMLSTAGFAQQINPITKAVLDGYTEYLKENPKDFQTYFERASQYYQLSMYDEALADVAKAIEYTPKKEADWLMQEYSLLSDIAVENKDYNTALKAIESALEINPEYYPNIYKKGNIQLYLNMPEEAYKTFSVMQRLKSRSQEAYFGMAKSAIMMGKTDGVDDLIRQAQDADPSNPVTYNRVGDLYADMGQTENATANYLMAISIANDPKRSVNSLVDLANNDYSGVAQGLDFAINKTQNKAPLYYLKGNLAYKVGNYSDARVAFSQLLGMKDGRVPNVYASLAASDMAMNLPEEALLNINNALSADLSAAEILDYNIIKARALLASGQDAAALLAAQSALEADPSSVDAMMQIAQIYVAQNDGKKALEILNEAVMTDPENIEALMVRGFVNEEMLKDGRQAVADYQRAGSIDADTFPGIALRALGKARSGKKLDADALINDALGKDLSANDCYYIGVYFAQTGNLEKAAEYVRMAIDKGYQNQYNLKSENFANLSITPIRHLLK